MSDETQQETTSVPRVPLGPDRPAFKKSTRHGLALLMGLAVVTALVVGILAATMRSKPQTPHVVTIPAADRNAGAARARSRAGR